MICDEYPGLMRGRDRLARVEQVLRCAAMFDSLEDINGVPVFRLTPRHVEQLLLVKSPFFYRGIARQPEHVAQFLWIVAPSNRMNGKQRGGKKHSFLRWLFRRFGFDPSERDLFVHSLPLHNYRRFYRAIDRYLDRMFLDSPSSAANGKAVGTAVSIAVVNRLGRVYGWPDQVMDDEGFPVPGGGILDMPLVRLYQYIRWIDCEKDPELPTFSKLTDAFTRRTISKWHRRAKAAGFEDDRSLLPAVEWQGVRQYMVSIGKLPPSQHFAALTSQPV